MKPIVIIGAGGLAREVAWLIEEINAVREEWELLGYVDEDRGKHGLMLNNYKVLGGLEILKSLSRDVHLVCAIGDPQVRKSVVGKVRAFGLPFSNLVHPSMRLSPYVSMGTGNILFLFSTVTVNISIGNHNIINYNCTVGHDVLIKNYCTVFPGANISGSVVLNDLVAVGANACVIQGVTVGEGTIIGAGSVVIRDLPPHCTAVGVPAKPIKFHHK